MAINPLYMGVLSQALKKKQGKPSVNSLHFSYSAIKHMTVSWATVFTTNK